VEENLRIAADARPGPLTAAEIGLIAGVGRKYREIMKVGCTGCGYCQPCPSGVDIAGCFDLFNAFHTFGRQEAGFLYVLRAGGVLSGRPAYASLCSRCLDCLPKCPQHLEIPDLLEQVAAQFEAEGLREREAMVRRFFLG
jgi:predicted aldo/keto reductase-like oxidoreductase